MNLVKQNWSSKDYQEYIEYLKSLKEEEYKNFHSRITRTKYEILGIRVPMQRKIAKEIKKGNYVAFLKHCGNTYYEEVNIEGFVIASIKEEERDKYLDVFLNKIDNWAICDGFCNSLKITSKENYLEKIEKMLQSNETYIVRVGLVLLLSSYVEEKYIKTIISLVENLKKEEYYINMAIAWLVAECFIKYPNETLPFLKSQKLNKFTQNKTISKINDSYRVSKEIKLMLKEYRIK